MQLNRQACGIAAKHLLDGHAVGYRPGTTGVIGIGVADQHQIECFYAQFAQ
ncbi:hypothetical protein D3C75_1181220 [compost metagenome]